MVVYESGANVCQEPVASRHDRAVVTTVDGVSHSRSTRQTRFPGVSLRTLAPARYWLPATVEVTGRGDVVNAYPGLGPGTETRAANPPAAPPATRTAVACHPVHPERSASNDGLA